MGSKSGPNEIVRGAAALTLHDVGIHAILVGDGPQIETALATTRHNAERLSVHHVPDFIASDETSATALRAKSNASIAVAAQLVRDEEADALVWAGNAGAGILACRERFSMVSGVRTPALATVFPSFRDGGVRKDSSCLLLDVGASADASAEELTHFGIMGECWARIVMRIASPRVALLSSGVEAIEEAKRITYAREYFAARTATQFVGVIEATEIPMDRADVVVCDGLLGNVCMKLLDGTAVTALALARSAATASTAWKLGLAVLSRSAEGLKAAAEWRASAAAPLLGLDGTFLNLHPSSKASAVAGAGKVAARAVRADLPRVLAREFAA